jgi:hypothetical protein
VLRAKRDESVKAFLRKAIGHQGPSPKTITLDGYATTHRAVREMKAEGLLAHGPTVRSSQYLNSRIVQDHRNVKSRASAMLSGPLAGNARRLSPPRQGGFHTDVRTRGMRTPGILQLSSSRPQSHVQARHGRILLPRRFFTHHWTAMTFLAAEAGAPGHGFNQLTHFHGAREPFVPLRRIGMIALAVQSNNKRPPGTFARGA